MNEPAEQVDMPVRQLTKVELMDSAKAARTLGPAEVIEPIDGHRRPRGLPGPAA